MPNTPKTKKGCWSLAEQSYVRENHAKVSVEDMALHLNRDPETLKRWIDKNLVPEPPKPKTPIKAKIQEEKREIQASFRNSLAWKKLKDEFTDDELAYFEEEYIDLFQQFQADVFKTEEQQIRKTITLDILMRRNLATRKKLLADIDRLESWMERASRDYKKDKASLSDDERQQREEFLLNLETQLQGTRSNEQSKTKEFSDLDTRHQKLMEALKATREQRVTKYESGKQSWLSTLRDLADQERAEQEGRLMELMREATGREASRLGKKHVYDDGAEDRPILSAETVVLEDDDEEDDE